ncbi:MAG TPA: TetR/AcrR family transcriptional regulator [Streptosporangiaceae bacterium]|nr:TetR/AcrR family transcriptional regulator [Streptosporangiaceae bacterium]
MTSTGPAGDGSTESSTDPRLPPVIWMMPERPARGPKPAHSRDEIAAAAIKIADGEGLDAVTMRRVAAEIGCGTMTLYRYVPTKDGLFDLMIDATAGEEELVVRLPGTARRSGPDWRAGLRAIAQAGRATLLRHPWLVSLQSGRPSFGPNGLRNLELGFGMIDHLDLDVDQMMIMLNTVVSFVRGAVVAELAEQEAQRRTGLDQQQWQRRMAPYVRKLMDSGQYPMFNRIIAEAKLPHSEGGADEQFSLQLDRVLDGLAADLPAEPEPGD